MLNLQAYHTFYFEILTSVVAKTLPAKDGPPGPLDHLQPERAAGASTLYQKSNGQRASPLCLIAREAMRRSGATLPVFVYTAH